MTATIERTQTRKPRSRESQEHFMNFRVSTRTRDRITMAAEILGVTKTQFVIEMADKAATDVLLDRRLFELDEADFKAFTDILDNPPPPSDQLRQLFKEKAPWEK